MFVQVIQSTVADAEEIREALERWTQELSPGADGWLGTTAGVTDDGRFIAMVGFESEQAARRNGDRPEQTQWWMETSKLFGGEITVHDCPHVDSFGRGGVDQAGFVQIIQSGVRDPEGLRDLMRGAEELMSEFRPEVIGGISALHADDDGLTTAIYFTSEADAREGERKEPSPQVREVMERQMRHYVGRPVFFDLLRPWRYSPP